MYKLKILRKSLFTKIYNETFTHVMRICNIDDLLQIRNLIHGNEIRLIRKFPDLRYIYVCTCAHCPHLELLPAGTDFGDENSNSVATGNLEAPPLTGYKWHSDATWIAVCKGRRGRGKRERESKQLIMLPTRKTTCKSSMHYSFHMQTHPHPLTHTHTHTHTHKSHAHQMTTHMEAFMVSRLETLVVRDEASSRSLCLFTS